MLNNFWIFKALRRRAIVIRRKGIWNAQPLRAGIADAVINYYLTRPQALSLQALQANY